MTRKFIKMNVALAGFAQGQQWSYDKAPEVVKMWLEKECILFETKICSLSKEIVDIEIEDTKQPEEEKVDEIILPKPEPEPEQKRINPRRGRPKGSKGSGRVKMKKQINQEGNDNNDINT
jgi:hypothetical protein